jgi:hypothetical protein
LRAIVDQTQTFARAEIELLKDESRRVLVRAAVALVVLLGSGLLLAMAVSLAAAAVALTCGASPVVALLSAGAADVVIGVIAALAVLSWARDPNPDAAASPPHATNLPQHGSTLS